MYIADKQLHRLLLRIIESTESNPHGFMLCENLPAGSSGMCENMAPKMALNTFCKYLLRLFLFKLDQTYPADHEFEKEDQAKHLQDYRKFYGDRKILQALLFSSPEDDTDILPYLNRFPAASSRMPSFFHTLEGILLRLAAVSNASEAQIWKVLFFEFSKFHRAVLEAPELRLDPEMLSTILKSHASQRIARMDAGYDRRLKWGKELDDLYRVALAEGLSPKTAKICSRQQFIKIYSSIDPESLEISPGLTQPSLASYHKAYLDTLS